MKLLRWLFPVIDRIFCIVLAIGLAQFPPYYAQYVKVLSGASQQTAASLEKIDQSISEELSRHQAREDLLAQQQQYEDALFALSDVAPWEKPFKLIGNYDRTIGQAVLFQPEVPLDWEGWVYGLIGLGLALVVVGVVKKFLLNRKNDKKG
ncbi:MAG: DUF2937 family protein [Bacteroidota bacterium]